ncbi:SDR family NAD(P)-dependent oxidoreductase [Desulfofustis glycolicus]|uniref:3-oxoacyl-[acyl-carrier protein] reductase n=1 Tax=Desulfofustis glycolicus DSM 9705 TaxID=1121409 RepID=A0A1M5YKV5_9BACT|nr:SDR family oxidoreductase [Desulfofustis glycolicus]MCB2214773.1 SDR family oxidoreductase [Desulfobulbaceae bacterium]SHI12528.1 3-oxoacyl-[acyl-carrier protein] reductase [Desulfofustis glycolicus DSM 9705]
MEMHLQNKMALVTGGARGIGESIAAHLVAEGVRVVIGDIAEERAERACRTIGENCSFVYLDVTDRDSVDSAVQRITEELGQIDILVNNAGISRRVTLLSMEPEEWLDVFRVNAYGPYLTTRAVLPQMIKREKGKIVNIAAISGKKPMATYAHYSASKAALIAFTEAVALEYAAYGLNINAVCPGAVATELWSLENLETSDKRFRASFDDDIAGTFSLGRAQRLEDVANMVCYLCSDLTKNITGQSFNVTS